jgi:hypothetical protein
MRSSPPRPTRPRPDKPGPPQSWPPGHASVQWRGRTRSPSADTPQLKEQIASIRQLVVHAALSVGERELLQQFAQFVREIPPPDREVGVRSSSPQESRA